MYFYTLNSQNPSKLYLWEIEDVSIQEKLHPHLNLSCIKSQSYYVFEELRRYPNNQVVFAKVLFSTNPIEDLGIVALCDDKWYRVIGDKPIKTFYVRKQDQFCFKYFSEKGELNEFIKYEYRGN